MYGVHPSAYLSSSASLDPRLLQFDPLAYSSLRNSSPQQQQQLGPTPLVMNLLDELKRSKEEAEWAKRKLAETLVRLNTQEESLHQLRTSAGDPSSPVKDLSSPAKHPSRGPPLHSSKGLQPLRPKASAPPTILESSIMLDDSSMLDDGYDYSSDFESVNRSQVQLAPTAEGSGPAPATTIKQPASISSRDQVMQPLRENLARSLLASQVGSCE